MSVKCKLKKGDRIEVMTGKNRGREGSVLKVLNEKNRVRVLVEGVNKVIRHTKPGNTPNAPGGKIEKEAPLHISNVALVCPSCNKPTRVGHGFVDVVGGDKKQKIRVCRKCGKNIDVK